MVYKVIGLMSGSSLDGLDIVYTQLEEVRGKWTFEIMHAECLPYTEEWVHGLKHIAQQPVADFLRFHTCYGRYLGGQVNSFVAKYNLTHKVHFIASHGHTVLHEPEHCTTFQIGDGAALAAVTGLPVISDLRALDVALKGQGAPIVPIGDKLLFGEYDYWLNIGGIANITIRKDNALIAFDVCPANQILNALAEREGKPMDKGGAMAAGGKTLLDVLGNLNDAPYYQKLPPKSLSNEQARDLVFPDLLESKHININMLHTMVQHIADQVARSAKNFPHGKEQAQMLITGGGAFNTYLIKQIEMALTPLNIAVAIPDATVVKFKEALIMALIGTLRWREETNVLSSVTGATVDSIGGALWMGSSDGEAEK